VPLSLDELRVQQVESRVLDRCAAAASTWTRHTVQEHVTRIITEAGVRAEPAALRDLIAITTMLAMDDCLSVLPPGTVQPDHVAHLTSLHVVAVETRLRDMDLDPEQVQGTAAVASNDPLVVVDGAGKTTMIGAAIHAAAAEGRVTRIVTPTKKAAQVAQPNDSECGRQPPPATVQAGSRNAPPTARQPTQQTNTAL